MATSLRIVLIEDNQDHARILRWAFEQTKRPAVITFFPDGESAVEHLHAATGRPGSSPDLIFLDLNLPKMDGRQVLRFLKEDPATRGVPVIVLSSSEREEDVRTAYDLGASTYISKSVVMNEMSSSLTSILDYWSRIARLPKRRT
jgi:CheY-like chemotaxis protein